MKKNNIKKSTTKKLGSAVVKGKNSAKNQKLTAELTKRKATAARNSFRRALYRANKIIASGNSFFPKEKQLSMNEFKKLYEGFGKRTGMLKGKTLNEGLKIFLGNDINSRTPKQCESAVDNLMKHLNDAVSAFNGAGGDTNKLSDTNKKYIKVLEEVNALKNEINEELNKKLNGAITTEDITTILNLIDAVNKRIVEIPNLTKAIKEAYENLRNEEEEQIARGGKSITSSMDADEEI